MRSFVICACLCTASCILERPLERCNGVDDDGDPETVDGIDASGEPCDGPDTDQCAEGTMVCRDGELVCNDDTGDALEQCNQLDDDCDGSTDEGFDLATDPLHCGACGHSCTNANGPTSCSAGACAPTCAAGAIDCNGNPDDGCEVFRGRGPACPALTNVPITFGDAAGVPIERHGTDEETIAFTLQEVSMTSTAITATVSLEVPPGVDFDLYLYCGSCGGLSMGASRNAAGMREEVGFWHRDTPNVNDDQLVYAEVRFVGATTCAGEWKLRVIGGSSPAAPAVCGAP